MHSISPTISVHLGLGRENDSDSAVSLDQWDLTTVSTSMYVYISGLEVLIKTLFSSIK